MPVPKGQGLGKGDNSPTIFWNVPTIFRPFSIRETEQKVRSNEPHSDPHSHEISHTHSVLGIGEFR